MFIIDNICCPNCHKDLSRDEELKEEVMREIKEIIKTLRNADCECTDSPYWLILDPSQMLSLDNIDDLAGMITGPFFCRRDAEEHLRLRRYDFSKRAVVYCMSGYWADKYRNLCGALKIPNHVSCNGDKTRRKLAHYGKMIRELREDSQFRQLMFIEKLLDEAEKLEEE